jgi:multimeric flavodoxin WrbA
VRHFSFVVGSTRDDGNSEALARAAPLPAGATASWLLLRQLPLPPFADTRHSTGYVAPAGHAKRLCEATVGATDLVLVTPVNWYSVSWPMKLYLDHWSAWMRIPELAFADTLAGKSLWAVVVDSDDNDAEGSGDPVVDMLRRTAAYMKMRWRGALRGHGNRPGEIAADAAAMARAATYFTAA